MVDSLELERGFGISSVVWELLQLKISALFLQSARTYCNVYIEMNNKGCYKQNTCQRSSFSMKTDKNIASFLRVDMKSRFQGSSGFNLITVAYQKQKKKKKNQEFFSACVER